MSKTANSPTPDIIFAELFEAVQASRVFSDSKTFVDAVPRYSAAIILQHWQQQKQLPGFDLAVFVADHFQLPAAETEPIESERETQLPVREHIRHMWSVLRREPDEPDNSSLLALPHPYIVPGGRFREIYYWDSWFTMLGLAASDQDELLQSMLDNFAWLIDTVGHIPNGNRSYYTSRSQPPLFALMVETLAQKGDSDAVYNRYYPQLQAEYAYWMAGADTCAANEQTQRVVRIGETTLNRYWDDNPAPRQESWIEDIEIAERAEASVSKADCYRHIRAAAESGWDFSCRWMTEIDDLASMKTTDIVPVDLNCFMWKLETILARAATCSADKAAASKYQRLADARGSSIVQLFYDAPTQAFCDLFSDGSTSPRLTLATTLPLYFGLAEQQQADSVAALLQQTFLCPGGWVTTPYNSGQQWDSPNGWAPLQWFTDQGLRHYGHTQLANSGSGRWIDTNIEIYKKTGNLLEKYNVVEPQRIAGGGEYELQSGFGWTNAVLLLLMNILERE